MAMKRPILPGVEGEIRDIIEKGNCSLCIQPENDRHLAKVIVKLWKDSELANSLGANGCRLVVPLYNLDILAASYINAIQKVGAGLEV
jgi:glycosyltransferase involved in cell wall biosynthesis